MCLSCMIATNVVEIMLSIINLLCKIDLYKRQSPVNESNTGPVHQTWILQPWIIE